MVCVWMRLFIPEMRLWLESKLETIFNFVSALERDARERRVGQKINIKKEHCTLNIVFMLWCILVFTLNFLLSGVFTFIYSSI